MITSGRKRGALEITGLSIRYDSNRVVHNVDLSVPAGGTLALVGQSGSGKSTIANTVLRVGPQRVERNSSITFDGRDILRFSARRFRDLLKHEIAYVPQFPLSSLNPTRRISAQLRESFQIVNGRHDVTGDQLEAALTDVEIRHPERILQAYPHELSGGQLQRILIAMAIAKKPSLIIADEPTSALDISLRRSILELLQRKQHELGCAILLITHDLSVAKTLAEDAVILKEGAVVESGTSSAVLDAPTTEYGRLLADSIPEKNVDRYWSARETRASHIHETQEPVILVEGVSKTFGAGDTQTVALDQISLEVAAGTTYAIVGESGSGKTTLARTILGLAQPDSGSVTVNGQIVRAENVDSLRAIHRNLQFVYQDGSSSLDPRFSALRSVAEPLQRFGILNHAKALRLQSAQLLQSVGVGQHLHKRRPQQLSGGQRQRVAVARSIAPHPHVVVLDEPTSALDVSVQATLIDLLVELQLKHQLTYVLVSHDLALVRQFADRVAVMRDGQIIEEGAVEDVYERPQHEFTRLLIANSFLDRDRTPVLAH